MRIKSYGIEYVFYFRRGSDVQTVEVVDASGDKEVKKLFFDTFHGRTHNENPQASFVKVIIKSLDPIKKVAKVVMLNRVYNLSPRNARIELENAIRMTQ